MTKNILITGATTGLGYDIFKELSKDNSVNLICTYKDPVKKKKIKNAKKSIQVNFFEKNFLENFVKQLGNIKIDSVIHCAGGGLGYRENNISLLKLQKLIELNFYSLFEINSFLIKRKKMKERLNIIHIGSLAAFEVKASIGYSLAKATLTSYNKNLAFKYVKENVISKLLIPGSFVSSNGSMYRLKQKKNDIFKKLEKEMPKKKMISSKKLIPIIQFLLNKDSDLLTGTIISATNLESKNNLN